MGLNVYTAIRKSANVKARDGYIAENWPKVESGEITMKEYGASFPKPAETDRHINLDEFGVRNFWDLHKYLIETMGFEDKDLIALTADQVKDLKEACETYKIPEIDNYSYHFKCADVATMCRTALKDMAEDEVMEFFFEH